MRHCANPLRCYFRVFFLILLTAVTAMSAWSERKVTKLADGVFEIQHDLSGNTTVIIGDRQVFVVDTCFLPSQAREDIAQIRQWTDKPVSFVLNTHFHNDHNIGNQAYMEAFPALTIIAHVETKREMDLFGPGSARREEKGLTEIKQMLEKGTNEEGKSLTDAEKAELKSTLVRGTPLVDELKTLKFQSATLAFDHDFSIDIGNREVQVKFLGRGNTGGDAIAYLPKERIVAAGDLVVYPIPYVGDGYVSEWIQTLQNLAQLDVDTIVPGHGPILHDKTYIYLIRDWMKSAVDQMNEELRNTAPAAAQTLDAVKGGVDLTSFRDRFAGNDKDLRDSYDYASASLIKIIFEEDSLH
jgi:cyclase